jgi:hypothetical protein
MTLDWKIVTLASVVTITVGALTFTGKIPSDVVVGLVSGLAAWLLPSPLTKKGTP